MTRTRVKLQDFGFYRKFNLWFSPSAATSCSATWLCNDLSGVKLWRHLLTVHGRCKEGLMLKSFMKGTAQQLKPSTIHRSSRD